MAQYTYAENSVRISQVYGSTWEEIQEEARRIASMPGGIVTADPEYPTMNRTFHGKNETERRPDWNCRVVVTPPGEDGRYTLEEFRRAMKDLLGAVHGVGGASQDKFADRVAVQMRKNRAFGAR